jgi:sialidase-1
MNKTTRFAVWMISLAAAFDAVAVTAADSSKPAKQPLFRSGENGYHTYRIPALIVTKRGTVLAFCEARKNSGSDHGDIDLVVRRSEDGGRTWSAMQMVADDGEHTMGNPCPVIDRGRGTIWLPFSIDNKRVLLKKSDDDGRTWSKSVDITDTVLNPDWHWVGPGPGHGIQLRNGRLLIPTWAGVEADVPFGKTQLSYVFYSDDAGKTWKLGGAADRDLSDECEVVELADGTIYMNARSRKGKRQRAVSTSKDGGKTWSPVKFDERLPEPSCQGSIIRLTDNRHQDKNRVILATPADPQARTKMTVRLSYDECQTWPVSKIVHEGAAAYSDLAVNNRHEILLAYEADGYASVTLARFDVNWLTDGKDAGPKSRKD